PEPCRGPPVDGPHVVPDHVLAQRVELTALATEQGTVLAVELAQPGQLLRQVPAAVERGEHPYRPRRPPPALARREPERPERADRDPCRRLVPPAVRAQLRS